MTAGLRSQLHVASAMDNYATRHSSAQKPSRRYIHTPDGKGLDAAWGRIAAGAKSFIFLTLQNLYRSCYSCVTAEILDNQPKRPLHASCKLRLVPNRSMFGM